ncbi:MULTISPECIES: hypothetical protein [Vibrio harveyi group]|uniref:hypothetical protein n=1 Tax=Vibrio harveyi group TaxID=717610 RepID=UPI001A1C39AF|nr:hypothetical protein [Vibrio parahaemolyticus]EGQ7800265.1 hypothetical protein [Vibrio parahaemolyticus]MCX8758027.1 hypothetical protein [Vibrio parahaemolyticus]MDF4613054.1 hypothetical protein [Vibrio parahaemolyticus]WOO27055.1 hypothetical protein R1T29_12735 [Vibrio parahaemolyticus]
MEYRKRSSGKNWLQSKRIFSESLKMAWAMTKQEVKTIKERLVELGGKEYTANNCNRVYLTLDQFNEITNLGYNLNEYRNKFYADLDDNRIYRKISKNGKSKVYHEFDLASWA